MHGRCLKVLSYRPNRELLVFAQVAIKDLMDHKHLDKDVLYFKNKVRSATLCFYIILFKSLLPLGDGLVYSLTEKKKTRQRLALL